MVVLLSASEIVQENPLTPVDAIEMALDWQTNADLAVRCQPSLCFIADPLLLDQFCSEVTSLGVGEVVLEALWSWQSCTKR